MGTYTGAEQAMIDLWISEQLTGHTAFNSINTGLTGRVFNTYAPDGTDYPYIIFQAQTPPEVVRGVGSAEVMVSSLYVVKAIAQGSSFDSLKDVAREIRTALVTPEGEAVTGAVGAIFTCQYDRQFSLVQPESTKQFRQLGGEYTIQAQAAA